MEQRIRMFGTQFYVKTPQTHTPITRQQPQGQQKTHACSILLTDLPKHISSIPQNLKRFIQTISKETILSSPTNSILNQVPPDINLEAELRISLVTDTIYPRCSHYTEDTELILHCSAFKQFRQYKVYFLSDQWANLVAMARYFMAMGLLQERSKAAD